ncbi:MAG TPA: carbamoyl phosphate synthase large subunit, partial [Planctomycetaceae bacterium]|nr:carbamoyl phosphate synthase large subunit [Planctomycetaceae bacterium]
LMNIQFAVKRGLETAGAAEADRQAGDFRVYILEVNPRASRTVPFVSKATRRALARIAAKVMAGASLIELGLTNELWPRHTSVKESVFPFNRFAGVDIILGPEMRSTGEVMGIDFEFPLAFAKSQIAAGADLPTCGTVFISMARDKKQAIVEPARKLKQLGFHIVATAGTARVLQEAGIEVEVIRKVQEGRPNLLDYLANGQIQFIFNTPSGKGARTDEGRIRAASVLYGVPCTTTIPGCLAVVRALEALSQNPAPQVQSLQEWMTYEGESSPPAERVENKGQFP